MELDFPHFADQSWWLRIHQGERMDTIAKGTLSSEGKVKIELSDSHKHFRGMAQWMLTLGGGLDVIFAGGENLSVFCPDPNPADGNIRYDNTQENTYLIQRYRQQQAIFAKADAMRMAGEAYQDDETLIKVFNSELTKLKTEYAQLWDETDKSKFYAARFAQIVDFTRGYGKSLPQDREKNNEELRFTK